MSFPSGLPAGFPPPPPPPRRRRSGLVVGLVVAVVALLVASTIAVVEFVQLREARQELERAGGQDAGEPEDGQGLGELFEDLFRDLLGEGGLPGGSQFDLFSCLSGGASGVQPAPAEGELAEQVRGIARAVEQIRQLRFEETVEPEFLSVEESADRVQEEFLKDYSADVADAEARILGTLGAIPPGMDLRETRAEALGAQVVGFYVPGTGDLVVRTSGDTLGPVDRVTLAHELEHALADQNLGFPIPLKLKPGREDRDLAALAVIEGDATLTMQRYAFTLPFDDQLQLADPSLAAEAEAGLAKLPHYLQQELLFPYEDGLSFVCRLYAAGGWEEVNRAYADPPTTSAQILFPERFAVEEEAVDPSDPAALKGGWTFEGAHEFGAANLLWLLEAPGGNPSAGLDDPMTGAGAWAGGEVHLWERGKDTAMGMALAEREGTDVLCVAISHWYAAAFPEAAASGSALNDGLELTDQRQDAVLTCSDDEVHLGIGPNLSTARSLAATS